MDHIKPLATWYATLTHISFISFESHGFWKVHIYTVGWLDYYCPICRLQRTLTFLVNDTFWETFQQNSMSIDLTKTKPRLFYKWTKVNLRFGGLLAFFVWLESSQRIFDIPTCLLPAIMNHFEEASHYTHQGKKLSKSKTWPVIQSCLKLWVETKKRGLG